MWVTHVLHSPCSWLMWCFWLRSLKMTLFLVVGNDHVQECFWFLPCWSRSDCFHESMCLRSCCVVRSLFYQLCQIIVVKFLLRISYKLLLNWEKTGGVLCKELMCVQYVCTHFWRHFLCTCWMFVTIVCSFSSTCLTYCAQTKPDSLSEASCGTKEMGGNAWLWCVRAFNMKG